MSNYTEADVERDASGLKSTVKNSNYAPECQRMDVAAIARLKAAALEGAKVPGLVKALDVAMACCGGNDETPREHTQDCERHRYRADRAEAQVSDLQARVAELEAQAAARDEQAFGLRQSLDGATKRVAALASERDALRARVKTTRAALEQVVRWDGFPRVPDLDDPTQTRSYGYAYGSNGERDFMRHVASVALSAPPAETTPAPNSPAVPEGSTDPVMEAVKLAEEAGLPVRLDLSNWPKK